MDHFNSISVHLLIILKISGNYELIEIRSHRIIESLRLEKTSKIIKSNHQSKTTMPDKPNPSHGS